MTNAPRRARIGAPLVALLVSGAIVTGCSTGGAKNGDPVTQAPTKGLRPTTTIASLTPSTNAPSSAGVAEHR